MRPMAADEMADTAAVVVINSRRTSSTQVRYSGSETQRSFVGQTQVPPLSERMDAFTDIYRGTVSDISSCLNAATDDVCHGGLHKHGSV